MSRKILGLDWFEVVAQVGITGILCAIADSMFGGQKAEAVEAAITGASLLVLVWRRRQALSASGEIEGDSGRLEDMEARLAELEQVQSRVAELEERVDFTERMLGQAREQERIPRG
jgi:hypothetical protein